MKGGCVMDDREWAELLREARAERDAATVEVARLKRILPPDASRSEGGVGSGSWAVFAEKAVAEREAAIEDLAVNSRMLARQTDLARQAENERDAAIERAEKAGADVRRMDWLERRDCWIGGVGSNVRVGNGLRAAIDAALSGEPKGEEG